MRKTTFTNNQFYHVYNRGVDKRQIFLDDSDYIRFIHYLYALNDKNPLINNFYRYADKFMSNGGGETSTIKRQERELLVSLHCFCLIPNHFHLILEQLIDNGITKFMQKLGTAYTMSFNTKNQREGVLFQGLFKAILIENDEYLSHLSRYIHLNSLELNQPNWKIKGINNWQKAHNFLESYRWSSYPDYIGKENFPSVINKNFLISCFGNQQRYKKFVEDFITDDIDKIRHLTFEF